MDSETKGWGLAIFGVPAMCLGVAVVWYLLVECGRWLLYGYMMWPA